MSAGGRLRASAVGWAVASGLLLAFLAGMWVARPATGEETFPSDGYVLVALLCALGLTVLCGGLLFAGPLPRAVRWTVGVANASAAGIVFGLAVRPLMFPDTPTQRLLAMVMIAAVACAGKAGALVFDRTRPRRDT